MLFSMVTYNFPWYPSPLNSIPKITNNILIPNLSQGHTSINFNHEEVI